jgi:virginiamycin B lyase
VARPYGIVVDTDDRPWIAFMGTNAIGTVDPKTNLLRILKTPDPASRIRRIGITSDGRIWWTDAARGFLGTYDPRDETMKQWRSPGGEEAGLYAMAVDARDRVWFVETGSSPNRFVGFDPAAEAFVANEPVPSGGGSVRHMVFDPETSAVWFGTDAHTIGRATFP